MWMRRVVVVLLGLALPLAGCSLAGRTFGGYVDDTKVTGAVKFRLAGRRIQNLAWVNVDTFERTVYLSGVVDSPEQKSDAEIAAWQVEGVQQVVNDLRVRGGAIGEDSGEAIGSALPDFRARHPVLARLRGVARVDAAERPGAPDVAYDARGRLVATVYTVPMRELSEAGIEDLRASGRAIDHVSIYPAPAHAEMPLPHYHVVLWHVTRPEAAALR